MRESVKQGFVSKDTLDNNIKIGKIIFLYYLFNIS